MWLSKSSTSSSWPVRSTTARKTCEARGFRRGYPYQAYLDPYYWVDDYPLMHGNNWSLYSLGFRRESQSSIFLGGATRWFSKTSTFWGDQGVDRLEKNSSFVHSKKVGILMNTYFRKQNALNSKVRMMCDDLIFAEEQLFFLFNGSCECFCNLYCHSKDSTLSSNLPFQMPNAKSLTLIR